MLVADADGRWPPLQDGRRVLAFPLHGGRQSTVAEARLLEIYEIIGV